ncbi:MAG: hypothetical protein ACK40G_11355 [Cytophagaceae bacterium]
MEEKSYTKVNRKRKRIIRKIGKPFVPDYPNKTPEEQNNKAEENDPNPNSDPNYSYNPGVAYPTRENIDKQNSEE